MLKALLIDDEERATDALRLIIEKTVPAIGEIKVCNDGRLAGDIIHSFQPDLVFLDIQMPHINGFELLEKIPNKNFKIIFTTAYNEYAIQAIRFSAFDYLLKPVDMEELQAAVQRFAESQEDLSHQQALLGNVMYNMQAPSAHDFRLALPAKDGTYFFSPDEIIRCEAIGNYTKFFTRNGKTYFTSRNLGEYDPLLSPYHFIRTHKSHLVNKKYISYIDNQGFVILKDTSKVEISRRRKKEVLAALK